MRSKCVGVCVFVGYGLMLACGVVMAITFYHAYFTDMTFSVSINSFGEAHVEAVLIPCLLFFGVFGFYRAYLGVKEVNRG